MDEEPLPAWSADGNSRLPFEVSSIAASPCRIRPASSDDDDLIIVAKQQSNQKCSSMADSEKERWRDDGGMSALSRRTNDQPESVVAVKKTVRRRRARGRLCWPRRASIALAMLFANAGRRPASRRRRPPRVQTAAPALLTVLLTLAAMEIACIRRALLMQTWTGITPRL